jgi:hypothetical protein
MTAVILVLRRRLLRGMSARIPVTLADNLADGRARACRAAGLRVRTGASEDGTRAWAVHVDHVVTAAETEAASLWGFRTWPLALTWTLMRPVRIR